MNTDLKQRLAARTYQSGTALIISLIMLVLITIIGFSSMQRSSLEERMTANQSSINSAFQASEAGLRAGENSIFTMNSRPNLNNRNNFYQANAANRWQNAVSHDTANAQFLVEEKGFMRDSLDTGRAAEPGRDFFMVFSRGEDSANIAEVVLESTYARRFN